MDESLYENHTDLPITVRAYMAFHGTASLSDSPRKIDNRREKCRAYDHLAKTVALPVVTVPGPPPGTVMVTLPTTAKGFMPLPEPR